MFYLNLQLSNNFYNHLNLNPPLNYLNLFNLKNYSLIIIILNLSNKLNIKNYSLSNLTFLSNLIFSFLPQGHSKIKIKPLKPHYSVTPLIYLNLTSLYILSSYLSQIILLISSRENVNNFNNLLRNHNT